MSHLIADWKRRLGLWLLDADPSMPRPLVWTPEAVEQFWSGVSRTRRNGLSFARLASRPLMLALRHHLRRGMSVVDFGAGSGHLVDALLNAGMRVAAFEPADARRAGIEREFAGRAGFLGAVGRDHGQQFDAAFAAEVVEHILDEHFDTTLRALVASVHIGGLLVVTTPNNEDMSLGEDNCPRCGALFHRWQHVRTFTPESLVRTLRAAGAEPIVTHVLEFNPPIFEPLEALDSGAPPASIADYLRAIRRDEPVRIGGENAILFIGRRVR